MQAQAVCRPLMIALFFLLTSIPFARAFAQQSQWVDLSTISHEISFPGGILQAGDSLQIEIRVGTESQPLDQVTGFALELELSALAQIPSSPSLQLENSWLNEDDALQDQSYSDPGSLLLFLEANRSNQESRKGYGELLSLTLICNTDSTQPQDLIVQLGGGMAIIDNLDMRLSQPLPNPAAEAASPLTSYPNPASEVLHVEGLSPGGTISLFNLSGTLVRETQPDEKGYASFQVRGLPAGIYFLREGNPSGKCRTRKILVQSR